MNFSACEYTSTRNLIWVQLTDIGLNDLVFLIYLNTLVKQEIERVYWVRLETELFIRKLNYMNISNITH